MKKIFAAILIIIFYQQSSGQNAFAARFISTKIKADFIDITRETETAHLLGNVVVEREDLSILADDMLVYYYEKKGEKDNAVKKIDAKNNVKIFNGEFVATGKYGFFNPSINSFILEENVVLNRRSSVAHGQKFIYDLKTKKGNLVGVKDGVATKKPDAKDLKKNGVDDRVVVVIDDNDFKKGDKKQR